MTREELIEKLTRLAEESANPGTRDAAAVLYFLASAMVMGTEDRLAVTCEKANLDNLRQLNAQNN